MMKKTVTLGISILMMGGLFGAWYLLKTGNEKAREQAELENDGDEIIHIQESNVSAISFEVDGETRSFVREDGTWKLEGDDHFTGDEAAFSALLGYFSPLTAARTLEQVEDFSEYGLDDPGNTFTITDTDGHVTVLLIGDNNEGTGDDYAMKEVDKDTVYTISTSLRNAIGEDLCDYASEEAPPSFSADSIISVEVLSDTQSYKIARDEDEWAIEGMTERLDQEAVEELVSTLGYLTFRDYVSYYCEDPSEYGLDEGGRILITYEESAGVEEDSIEDVDVNNTEEITETVADAVTENSETDDPHTGILSLIIGRENENGDYYVQMEGSKEVHTLSDSLVSSFTELNIEDLKEPETEAVTEGATE